MAVFGGVALVVALGGGCGGGPDATSSAGLCAAPEAKASHSQVKPADTVVVTVEDMWDGCNDQGETTPLPPLRDQPVVWQQDGQKTQVGTVSADSRTGLARIRFVVPPTATAGSAEIHVGEVTVPTRVTVKPG